jgi:hypothetical protein
MFLDNRANVVAHLPKTGVSGQHGIKHADALALHFGFLVIAVSTLLFYNIIESLLGNQGKKLAYNKMSGQKIMLTSLIFAIFLDQIIPIIFDLGR